METPLSAVLRSNTELRGDPAPPPVFAAGGVLLSGAGGRSGLPRGKNSGF